MSYQRGSFRLHEELKHRILEDPTIVGIQKENVLSIETEYPLHKRRRTLTARPDLAIIHVNNNKMWTTFVEIKSGSCRRARVSLQHQLRKIENYVRRQKIHANVVGVYPAGNALVLLS